MEPANIRPKTARSQTISIKVYFMDDFIKDLMKEVEESQPTVTEPPQEPSESLLDSISDMLEVSEESRQMPVNVMGSFQPLGPRTPEAQALDLLALQGATLGLPAKGLAAVGVEGPQKAVESARELTGGYGQASEALGMVPSSLLLPVSNIPKAVGYGGGYGLLSGLGLSERGEELETAGAYGLLGAGIPVVGGALRGLAQVGRGAGSAALEMFKPAKQRAVERIVETMEAAGTPPKSIPSKQIETTRPVTLAEAVAPESTGEGLEFLVGETAKSVGQPRTATAGLLSAREAARLSRLDEGFGAFPKGTADDVVSIAKEEAKNLTTKAYTKGVTNFPLSGISNRKEFLSAVDPKTGMALSEILNNELVDEAVKAAIKAERQTMGVTFPEGAKILSKTVDKEVPNLMRVFDEAKRILDRQIGIARGASGEAKDKALEKRLMSAKEAFLNALDEANPSYALAREPAERAFKIESAANLGKQIFSTGKKELTPKQISKELSKFTSQEKDVFRLGVLDKVKQSLADNDISAIKGLLKSKKIENMRAAWPNKESFDAFVKTLRSEVKMAESGKTMLPKTPKGPEDVGSMFESLKGAILAPSVAGRAAGQNKRSAAFVAGGNIVRALTGTGKMGADEALEVSNILLASTPAARKEAIDTLIRNGKVDPSTGRSILSGLGEIGSGLLSAPATALTRAPIPTVEATSGLLSINEGN